MSEIFIWNEAGVRELLEGEDGPVGRDLARRCVTVQRFAKHLAPVDTGRLRASIEWEIRRDDEGLFGVIGSDVEYAAYQELGTSRMPAHPYLRPALVQAGEAASDVGGAGL